MVIRFPFLARSAGSLCAIICGISSSDPKPYMTNKQFDTNDLWTRDFDCVNNGRLIQNISIFNESQ
jgi:hypothetical protein